MTITEIWETVKTITTETLTECDVIRDFDPTPRVDAMGPDDRPLAVVMLEKCETEALSRAKLQDRYVFSVAVIRNIQGLDDSAARAMGDACLEFIPRIQEAFFHRAEENGLKFLSANSEGQFFESDYFHEGSLFVAVAFVVALRFREI